MAIVYKPHVKSCKITGQLVLVKTLLIREARLGPYFSACVCVCMHLLTD